LETRKSPASAGLFAGTEMRLAGDRGEFGGVDVDEATVLALVLEADDTVDLGEEGIVFAAAHVGAGLERGASLTDDDASAEDCLTAEYLDAEPLCI
jgi:hypothetical protein